jgi:hypothetical protein
MKKTKAFNEDAQDEMVKELKTKFVSDFSVRPGYEWDQSSVLWSGEGAMMPDGMPAFDSMAYESDPNEEQYVLGVHKDLIKWSNDKGLFWEAHDPGTYLAYPV